MRMTILSRGLERSLLVAGKVLGVAKLGPNGGLSTQRACSKHRLRKDDIRGALS
jgi:hypothetical protein